MEIIFFALTLFISFFLLYVLCRQDFVLLRQNISLAQILDTGLASLLVAFATARLFYIFNTLDFSLLNVIKFLHFFKFPGLSFLGFTGGGFLSIYIFMRGKKGIMRIFDIFTIAFLPLYLFSLIFRTYPPALAIIIPVVSFFLFLFVFAYFLKSHYKYVLRDGSITLIFSVIISLDALFYQYLSQAKLVILFDLSLIQTLSILAAAVSIVLLFLNQRKLKI